MRILIIDDDPDLRDAVSLFFELKWPDATIDLAPDGRTGLKLQEAENPDIVLLDLGLPDMDGLAVCARIRERSEVPVVMLTARDRDEDIVKGLNAGADDYITKPFSQATFLARIQAIARRIAVPGGETSDTAGVFRSGELEIDSDSRRVTVAGKEIPLRPEEYTLLHRLTIIDAGLVKDSDLLELVWGREYRDATDYLESYMASLKEKLGRGPHAGGAILREVGFGYRYEPPASD
ncbi:MAG: response regulator transcription factor [Chloroflexi bacterium]|nr:response regulator transcription factor [Chloroflexota bacterium]